MATQVFMPKLGLTMTEGSIVHWHVQEGDPVETGQILFEVENDKSVTEIESQASGIMGPILVQMDELVPVGQIIAYILAPGETDVAVGDTGSPGAAKIDEPVAQVHHRGDPWKAKEGDVRASPSARRLARERGVDLAQVTGTGPGGRVKERDVAAFADQTAGHLPLSGQRIIHSIEFQGVRRLIADRMMQSLQHSAQLTLTREVDATNLVKVRQQTNDHPGQPTISLNAILIYLTTKALQEFPFMNARLVDNEIVQLESINMGLAVDTERGLIVPVIKNAQAKTLFEINGEVMRLIEQIRQHRIMPDDLTGGTFTISNLGALGVDVFTPILNPPECGILGVGRIAARPMITEGQDGIVIRRMMTLSLTIDHRIVDGAPAARFLAGLTGLVESLDLDLIRHNRSAAKR